MYPIGFTVDPDGLRGVAVTVGSVGSRLGGALGPDHESQVCPPGDGHGWGAWSPMPTVGSQWRTELAAVAALVVDAAETVQTVADGYDRCDESSGRGLGRVRFE